MPQDFEQAANILEASLAQVVPGHELSDLRASRHGLAGWVVWPMSEYIAQARPEPALHAMTQRFTAEWGIRPFIVNHPASCFATLRQWSDPSHVCAGW